MTESYVLMNSLESSEYLDKPENSHQYKAGRLNIKAEGGGKVRVFAVLDY
jgi:hypothetical protein